MSESIHVCAACGQKNRLAPDAPEASHPSCGNCGASLGESRRDRDQLRDLPEQRTADPERSDLDSHGSPTIETRSRLRHANVSLCLGTAASVTCIGAGVYLLLRAQWEALLIGLAALLVAAQIMMFCIGAVAAAVSAVAAAAMKVTRWFTSEADDAEWTTAWMVLRAVFGVALVLIATGYAVLIVGGMMGHASEYPVAVYLWAFAAVTGPWTYMRSWAMREDPSRPHCFEDASLVAACGTVILLAAFDLLGIAASTQMLCVAFAAGSLALLAVWRSFRTK